MTALMNHRAPELLAPAGNWTCVKAAVANGADAVYFGLSAFNARLRADNFTEADLPELMAFLHSHNTRGYLTLNVLVFQTELEEAQRTLQVAEAAGVDAIIVQDLGLAKLAQTVAPKLHVHASTQMTITSPEGVRFARDLGVDLVVLARELSLKEIRKFPGADEEGLPIEVFVHGALCVAYSGQCLTSESLGQRSANRGECAQACRLPYELVVDGKILPLEERRYLLSPQDLAAVDDIPALIEAGVISLKIEGRLKTPEYVAAVTQVYRRAIDRAMQKRKQNNASAEDRYMLEMTFSRGLSKGWLYGAQHQSLVHARFGTKRGAFAGIVKRVGKDFVELKAEVSLRPGDGLVFETGGNPDSEPGGRIYEIQGPQLKFQHDKINFRRIKPGQRVWKTSDPALEKSLRKTFSQPITPQNRPISFHVRGRIGENLSIEANSDGFTATASSSTILQAAQKQSLDESILQKQLGRLGGTGFELVQITHAIEGEVFLPLRTLNELRRKLVEDLTHQLSQEVNIQPQTSPKHNTTHDTISFSLKPEVNSSQPKPQLSVLCRSIEQIKTALSLQVETIYADFEDIRYYKDAVALVKNNSAAKILLATPRIQKAGEQGFFKKIENAHPHGVLIRNLGALAHFADSHLLKIGDFSLNVANALTAQILINHGLDAVTISYDLNYAQVEALLDNAPADWFELTLHQHMPLFHMEHCVFAAFLSNGQTHLDCGRPCENHKIHLKDRVGMEHPVYADVGCRNTVYHAKAQSGALHLAGFLQRGLHRFRLELVDEEAKTIESMIRGYQDLLNGNVAPHELLSKLKVAKQLGVTSGTLAILR